jgi:dynein heavy chain
LRDSSIVLKNYLNINPGKVPWDDLRYIFGEIMYGGHITDDRDRRFCGTFLDNLMNEGLLEEPELFPFVEGREMFRCPAPTNYDRYAEYINEAPPETPMAYGLHPNAEIDFRTKQCSALFATLQEIQPRGAGGGEGGNPLQERVQEFMTRVSDEAALDSNRLNVEDISSRMGEADQRTPFQNSFLQECQYMNAVIDIIVTDLSDIKLAFKGELTMTAAMETIMGMIFINKVPGTWAAKAGPSTRGLNSWLDNAK